MTETEWTILPDTSYRGTPTDTVNAKDPDEAALENIIKMRRAHVLEELKQEREKDTAIG